MKKFAKILAIVLALAAIFACVFGFAACNKKSDYQKIKESGKIVVGYTDYAPMNYTDANGTLVGFDTELAQKVGQKLGLQVQFQLISWDAKFTELNSGTIDCIWNGFTVTDERKDSCDFSSIYLKNKQVAVIRTADDTIYTNKDAFNGKNGIAEAGSYGEEVAKGITDEAKVTGIDTQMAALQNVLAGTADFAVVDYTLANANCGQRSFSTLKICTNVTFADEDYAVGFRKGSDITVKVNEALAASYVDGTVSALATKYELTNLVVEISK